MIWRWNGTKSREVHWHNSLLASCGILACNGPSLAGMDVSRLTGPGRTVFGVNNVFPRVRPDFWIGLDTPDCFHGTLPFESFPKIWRGNIGDGTVNDRRLKELPANYFADILDSGNFWDWSEKSTFQWTANSFHFALQFMLWLGIRHISFLGVDLSHANGDYAGGNTLTPEQREKNARLHESTFAWLRDEFLPQSKTLGVTCASITPQSRINALMPYVPLDAMLSGYASGISPKREKQHCTALLPRERRVFLVCRSGGEYRPEHVRRLISQLKDCEITVLTDFPAGDFEGAKVLPLLHNWPGWWSKMELCRPDIAGKFLYLDLDTTVHGRLPDEYWRGAKSLGLAPFTAEEHAAMPEWVQSGMLWLREEDRARIWERWMQNPEAHMAAHAPEKARVPGAWGDQSFLNECGIACGAWQDRFPNEIASYKMNWMPGLARDGKPLDRSKVRVLCFHGKPRPWEVEKPHTEQAAKCCPAGVC